MSVNLKMEKILKAKQSLEKKSINEGLTKRERTLLNEINQVVNEAPIDYEGPERMDPNIERKLTQGQTPFQKSGAIPEDKKRFLELTASKRFKDSVDKVRRYLGDTSIIQGRNPVMNLMGMAMGGLQEIMSIERQNKQYLENLAVELVIEELGIPEGSLQFDAKLIQGPMGAAEGMKTQSQEPDEEDVKDAFKNAEKHTNQLEEFADEFEKFDLERAKRRFINSLIQGAAFKGGHMFVLVQDKLDELSPGLTNLYGTTQALMEHLYWVYPDMEAMAGSGGGQLGQSEIDEQTDPPTVKARAATFPLLVHELVKGVYEIFGTHGLPDDPRQAEMVLGAEDTLPGEIWDSRLGPIFWEKFTEAYPIELFDEDKKHIQHYLFVRFSRLSAKEFLKVANLILEGKPEGKKFIQKMVDEIVSDLKKQDYEESMGGEDEDDIDLSDLGF
jgi:hypothetical protein